MRKTLSVVICTNNPRVDYLSRVLGSLRRQSLPTSEWDLLVVDNASEQPVAAQINLGWHPRSRCVLESVPGLVEARFRGVAESSGDFVVFVDDDTILAPDYLDAACRLAATFTHLGVFGAGTIEPEFEIPPPHKIQRYLPLLTVRKVRAAHWSNHPGDFATIPWGAGLVVSRSIAARYQAYLEYLSITEVLGRRGTSLYAGEDDLFSALASSDGLGFGIFPELRITHLIARQRLTGRHILKLVHDRAFSSGVLHYLIDGVRPQRVDPFTPVHVFLHALRNGLYSARCRVAALRGARRASHFINERGLCPIEGIRLQLKAAAPRLKKVR